MGPTSIHCIGSMSFWRTRNTDRGSYGYFLLYTVLWVHVMFQITMQVPLNISPSWGKSNSGQLPHAVGFTSVFRECDEVLLVERYECSYSGCHKEQPWPISF